MLQELRDKAKSFVSYALLILLIISFGIWGIGDIFRRSQVKDWVAKVDDVKVPPLALKREVNNQLTQMRMLLGPDFTAQKAAELGLVEQSLEKLLSVLVVDVEAKKLGLNVGKGQIVKTLEDTPQLRNPDGTFNKELFQRVLQQQGMNEADFIQNQRLLAARNLFVRGLSLPVVASETALNDFARAEAQQRIAELVQIAPADFSVEAPSAEALKKYYDENPQRYQAPETRNFHVLALGTADVSKDIAVSADDVAAYYNDNKTEFETPESRDVQQVVLSDETKAKEFAASAALTSLEQAAKTVKADVVSLPGSAENDFPADLSKAVFSATENKVSTPVQSPLGWHVFVVSKVKPKQIEGLEAVRGKLQEKIKNDKIAEALAQTANKIDDMLAAGKTLEEIAAAHALSLTPYEKQNAAGGKDGEKASFAETLKTAFRTNEGEVSPLVEAKASGFYVVRVDKIEPRHTEAFETAKDRVKTDLGNKLKADKAVAMAQAVSEQMKTGKPLAAVTGEHLKRSTAAPVTADNREQKDVPREALAPLFELGKGEVAVVSTSEGEVVVRVKDIIAGSTADVEKRKTALKDRLPQEWIGVQLEELNRALRNTHSIKIDEPGIKQLFSGAEDNS